MTNPLSRIYNYLQTNLHTNKSASIIHKCVREASRKQSRTITMSISPILKGLGPLYIKAEIYASEILRTLELLQFIKIDVSDTQVSVYITDDFLTAALHANDELEEFILDKYFAFYRRFMKKVKNDFVALLQTEESIPDDEIKIILDHRNQIQIGFTTNVQLVDVIHMIQDLVALGDGSMVVDQRKVSNSSMDRDVETCQPNIEAMVSENFDYTLITLSFPYSATLDEYQRDK